MPNVESLAEAPQSQGRSGAPLTVLFVTVFVDLLGFGIVIPFLPMYAERLEVGAAGIGLILAIYSLMQFLCAPILGRISDHVGRRPVIMIGLLGSSFSYFIYGFANSFVWLLVSRAVHGACAATVSTAQAYVADTTIESKRAHGMGMIGAAFGLGFVMGPARAGIFCQCAHLRQPDLRRDASSRIASSGPLGVPQTDQSRRTGSPPATPVDAPSARANLPGRVSPDLRDGGVRGDLRADGAGRLRLRRLRRWTIARVRGIDTGVRAGLHARQNCPAHRRTQVDSRRRSRVRDRYGSAGEPRLAFVAIRDARVAVSRLWLCEPFRCEPYFAPDRAAYAR